MKLPDALSRLFGARKKSAEAYPGTWVPLGGDVDGINERNLLEANREWVFIAVDKIASSLAGVRFKVMRYARSGDDQEVYDGPLVDFLERPGSNFTGKDFIYLNAVYKELTGNSFWERDGSELKPLIPTSVAPIVQNGELVGYKYAENGRVRVIPAEKVLHDRYLDPSRPYWGRGKLQRIARWVDTGSFVTEFLSRFFVNGATFGGFITTEEETEERINLIKIGLKNDHVGVENAHKIGVLPKGSEFKGTGSSMSDMEMGATDDRYRDKILAGFGVPKTLVGLTTEVNRASAEASEYIFSKYTLKPVVEDFIEFLNVNVAEVYDPQGRYYFAYDEFVPENEDAKLKERQAGLGNQPYFTVNEVRAQLGLPPVDGGDEVRGNPMLLPLGEAAPTPAPLPNDKPKEEKPQKRLPARARAGMQRERMIESIVTKTIEIASRVDDDAASHKKFVSRVEAHQDLLATKVRDFNNKQQRDIAQRLKQITKGVDKGDLFDMERDVALLIDFVSPILGSLMTEQALAEYEAQQFSGQLDPKLPRMKTVVAMAAKRLAKSYNETTANLLTKTLNEGIENGEDLTQLTKRVSDVYAFSDAHRAVQVAHTETFYIANEGSREAYRQSGVVESIRWYTAEDEHVCEFCGPMDGKIVGINEVFFPKGTEVSGRDGGTLSTDYRAVDVPPLHPLCRCFIRPEVIDIS